jgi:hypothetical protein
VVLFRSGADVDAGVNRPSPPETFLNRLLHASLSTAEEGGGEPSVNRPSPPETFLNRLLQVSLRTAEEGGGKPIGVNPLPHL